MATFTSTSPEATVALGEAWGREAQAGWVIGLVGDLGAGKTQLVKGLARGLGYPGRVRSPTFTLVHEYQGGRLPLYHLDLYRLDGPEQVAAAGLDEYLLAPDGVSVVEWAERWWPGAAQEKPEPDRLPMRFRWVRIRSRSENERIIEYEDFGA